MSNTVERHQQEKSANRLWDENSSKSAPCDTRHLSGGGKRRLASLLLPRKGSAVSPHDEPVDLRELASCHVGLSSYRAELKHLEIELEVQEDVPTVLGNHTLFDTLFAAKLDFALKQSLYEKPVIWSLSRTARMVRSSIRYHGKLICDERDRPQHQLAEGSNVVSLVRSDALPNNVLASVEALGGRSSLTRLAGGCVELVVSLPINSRPLSPDVSKLEVRHRKCMPVAANTEERS